jgi:hypothetical protein
MPPDAICPAVTKPVLNDERVNVRDVERDEIESAIRSAFADVRLGSGISLRQAQAIDVSIFGVETPNFGALPRSEVTDDWTRVPEEELLRDCIAHLDADGLRYYLPTLMLWLLDHYDDDDRLFRDDADLTLIGTIGALAPDSQFAASHWRIYDGFTAEQRTAIASYLESLPLHVDLDYRDAADVARSLEEYWAQFLPRSD